MNIDKVIKKLPKGFVEDAAGMGEKQLRDAIVVANASIRESEDAREADESLRSAKEVVKDLGSAYSDAITAQRAKVRYCLYRLDEQGKTPDTSVSGAEEAAAEG